MRTGHRAPMSKRQLSKHLTGDDHKLALPPAPAPRLTRDALAALHDQLHLDGPILRARTDHEAPGYFHR